MQASTEFSRWPSANNFEAIIDVESCIGDTEPNLALKRLACVLEGTGSWAN